MRHTPGPWHIAENEDNSFGRVTFRTICATSKNGTPFQLCLNSNYENLEQAEERKANANLIAAAPDLLEALTDLVGGCGKEGDLFSGEAMAKARLAIAKSEGKEE